jgi:hypothetical protein
MKKLSYIQLEALQGGAPEDCANHLVNTGTAIVSDPVYFFVYHHITLSPCFPR